MDFGAVIFTINIFISLYPIYANIVVLLETVDAFIDKQKGARIN